MSLPQTDYWPWLALAGLGAFHGLNPAMGWLFAVALGLHRHNLRVVWLAPLAIAFGHAISIAVLASALLWAGSTVDLRTMRIGGGIVLIGWALYHLRYGHRHRVHVGMQAGMAALTLWSFLMATAHGAGLMLWPVLMPLCFSAAGPATTAPLWIALMGIAVHTLAMLIVTTAVAVVVYQWVGLEILRRAWINVDTIWTLALLLAGALLLFG